MKEITSQKKNYSKPKKTNKQITWQRRTRDIRFFYFTDFEQVFVSWVISFIFSFRDY